jgi:gliding motility-associated-like protein
MTSATQVSSASCIYSANGSINWGITGGAPPLSYEWKGPNGPLSNDNFGALNNLVPGNYSVTATDAEGNTFSTSTTLTSQSTLAVTNVNELSNYQGFQVSGANQCDGIASVVFSGGVGNTSILWSNNVTSIQNNTLCAGVYSVTVSDGLGCTSVWSDELTSPPGVSLIQSMVTEISCHGECDGVARVTVSGGVAPYTVTWSTGQTDQVVNAGGFSQAVNLCGGDYKVTVTDKLGADYVYDLPIPEPEPIVLTFASVAPTTFNACNGEIIAEAPGAVEPIVYTWSGSLGHSGNSQRAEGLCSGEVVQFVLYDANGCAGTGVDTVAYAEDGCYQVRPVITPGQQDGNNDFVFITCIENVPNTIEIFNRWGQLVFETNNYDNASNVWDGTTKDGQPLAEGVYYYVLSYTDPINGSQQKKGHINLLR